MKLTVKDLNKQIRRSLWSNDEKAFLRGIYKDRIWYEYRDRDGDYQFGTTDNDNAWLVLEPEKKPSERIRELFEGLNRADYGVDHCWIVAIHDYLDEVFEQGKLK